MNCLQHGAHPSNLDPEPTAGLTGHALQNGAVDCEPILDALQSRVETPGMSAADLLTVCRVLATWDAEEIAIPAALAASMTKRMAAVGVVDGPAAKWSARKTKGSADARLLLVAVIKDPAVPLAAVLDAVSSTAGVFRRNP